MSNSDASDIPDWKRPAILGYLIVTLTFLVFGAWSAIAKLDSAVVASGVVAVESNRKTVQHLEGGIIQEILVREGQRVTQGDILFRMDPTQALASFDLQQNQLYAALAQEARLVAEREGAAEVTFPEELRDVRVHPTVARAVADQTKEFHERRASLLGQMGLLEAKIGQYKTEIEGLLVQQKATEDQLRWIVEELADLRYLLDRNLVQKTRVLALEREKSRLEGVIGRSTADQAKAQNGIGEAQLQIRQLHQKFRICVKKSEWRTMYFGDWLLSPRCQGRCKISSSLPWAASSRRAKHCLRSCRNVIGSSCKPTYRRTIWRVSFLECVRKFDLRRFAQISFRSSWDTWKAFHATA
jgi:HlyD family type I secretion membrane fusion protein